MFDVANLGNACGSSLVGLLVFLPLLVHAEGPPADLPHVAVCNPLGVKPGSTAKVIIRGWKLDQATEVRLNLEGAAVKVLNKGNANVPGGQDAKKIGDTQVEVEITVPEASPADKAELVIVTPKGESKRHPLLLGGPSALVNENETNDGFQQAQGIEPLQIVQGEIHEARNVDVFSFPVQSGQTITAEVLAQRHGSSLDGTLTLYDERGTILKTSDDTDTADPKLEYVSQQSARLLLVIQDAHDRGGAAHPYRLVLTAK